MGKKGTFGCGQDMGIWGACNEAGHGYGHRGVSVDTGAHGFGTAFRFLFKVGIMLSLTGSQLSLHTLLSRAKLSRHVHQDRLYYNLLSLIY